MVQMTRGTFENRNRRPFQFLASWITHDDFNSFIKSAQRNSRSWNQQIKLFQEDTLKWNREVFGHIFSRKKELLKKLRNLERCLGNGNNHNVMMEQQMVWREYEQVLIQEEVLWFQKSRTKCLTFGDRNTKFFHGIIVVRRRRNKIDVIQNEEGVFIVQKDVLENYVISYFKNLFSDDFDYTPFCLTNSFPSLDPP